MQIRTALFGFVLAVGALSARPAAAEEFSGATGPLGAGLDTDGGIVRAYGEMGLFTQGVSLLGTPDGSVTNLNWLLGVGVRVSDHVEIEAQLPVTHTIFGSNTGGADQAAFGNLSLGANWLTGGTFGLLKVGGALAFGPWNDDSDLIRSLTLSYGLVTRGYHEMELWTPQRVSLIVPARVELGTVVRFTGDAKLALMLPTGAADTELTAVLAPGVSVVLGNFAFGARLPATFIPTATDGNADAAQIAVEPFARLGLGPAFLSARVLVNLDSPLGPSFDTGRAWGVFLGGGLSF